MRRGLGDQLLKSDVDFAIIQGLNQSICSERSPRLRTRCGIIWVRVLWGAAHLSAQCTRLPLPCIGSEVVVRGLHTLLREDRLTGIISSYDPEAQKFIVLLDHDC